jgi:hypothetical protein
MLSVCLMGLSMVLHNSNWLIKCRMFVSDGVKYTVTSFAGSLGSLSSSSTLGSSTVAPDQANVIPFEFS